MLLTERFKYSDSSSIKVFDRKVAFDVGSGTGGSIVGIKSMRFRNVVCIEAESTNFEVLQKLYKTVQSVVCLNAIIYHSYTIPLDLYRLSNIPFSSTLYKEWLKKNKFVYREQNLIKDIAPVLTVDMLTGLYGIPGYVNIDTNGSELDVLCGMSFKPELVSFSWNSNFLENCIGCLIRLKELQFKKFCIMGYNEVPMFDDIWFSYKKCIDIISKLSTRSLDSKYDGGTIFCK